MAFVISDRIKETSITTGNSTFTLNGAVTGFTTFAAVGNGNTCTYAIIAVDSNGVPTGEWETGIGTYTSSGTTLSRGVIKSSNSNSLVNFSAGTKHVICTDVAGYATPLVMATTANRAIQVADQTALSSTAGNARGQGAIDLQIRRTSATEVASGINSVISGGMRNSATGYQSTVCGGMLNSCTGTSSSIVGGGNNTVSSDYSILAGGVSNSLSSNSSVIGGGTYNSCSTGHHIVIGGGGSNIVSGNYSVIGGGTYNSISSSVYNCTIGGGSSNAISGSGSHSTIGGGIGNSASGYQSTVCGGSSCTSSGSNSVSSGMACQATGDGSVAIGVSNTSSGKYSKSFGYGAKANKYGQFVLSNGWFSSAGAGSAQHAVYVLRKTTTNNTQTELFLDGSSERMNLADYTTWTFQILAVARRTDQTGESAGYIITGVIDNNAGTTALVGTITKTVLAEDSTAWDISVQADDTNDALVIKVTGETSKTINWVCSVWTSEVTG